MFRQPKALKEIHKIQESIYREEKRMTPKERVIKIHQESNVLRKKYGLTSKQTV